MKPSVVAIVGPTGVGKTKLSIETASRFNGEVISGDSMQIYKGMDIGTAKVTDQEKKGIPHHMVDILTPGQPFSAADYQTAVMNTLEDILSRKKLPVIAGGTGLYIQSVLYGYQFSPQQRNMRVQNEMEAELKRYGAQHMWKRLQVIDPSAAEKIHPNNHRRLIRALEVVETTGESFTSLQKKQTNESSYHPIIIGLEMDREMLYERINQRVDQMIERGLLKEVQGLYEKGLEGSQALQAIGYKEFLPYFKGERTLDESINHLKRNSRRYAKRQYTWFRNKMNVTWYSITPETANEKFAKILDDLAGKLEKT